MCSPWAIVVSSSTVLTFFHFILPQLCRSVYYFLKIVLGGTNICYLLLICSYPCAMTNVMNGDIGKQVFQRVADEQGILPLGCYYLGTRQVSLSEDKEIKTPADLNGINLRMPNSDAWVFLGKAMGANPTAIAFNDLYLALQTGTVDGQDNPLPTVQSAKFYEVQKSISLTNHLVDSVWPTINVNTWNKLTDTQKGWVMEAVEAGRKACDEQNLKTEAEVQDFLREKGLAIYEADVSAFAKHVLDTYLGDPISETWDKDLLNQIQSMA
ncbi:hypothetical protein D7Y09_14295 [bacterium 1XD42-1]|nr:hypothetical protein D7X25_32975 [bacterium 1XD42-8]RKJ62211.1 hypothetical protein D7Y09_14295 [bacterium 1XD42-1]